jgi:ketosteroid isomerase-like protein
MSIEDEVRAFNDAFERALMEQDVETLLGLYADDAWLLLNGQPGMQGRAAVETLVREWLADGPVSTKFETAQIFASGDLVVDIGYLINDDGRGKYVVIHRRGPDGRLRILVDAPSRGA